MSSLSVGRWGVKTRMTFKNPCLLFNQIFRKGFANGKQPFVFSLQTGFPSAGIVYNYISGLMHVEVVSGYICFFVAEINEST